MKRVYFLLIPFFLALQFSLNAQDFKIEKDSILEHYLNKVSQVELKKNLSIIASDSMMGRETGTPGQKIAAEYLVKKLNDYGIVGAGDSLNYYQRFALYSSSYEKIELIVDSDTLLVGKDFYTFSAAFDTVYSGNSLTFLGYGIDADLYSDYTDREDNNGMGVILSGEPILEGEYFLSGSDKPSEWSDNVQLKIDAAQRHGLSGLIIVNERFSQLLPRVVYYQKNSRPRLTPFESTSFPVLVTGPSSFNALFSKMNYEKAREKLNKRKPSNIRIVEKEWFVRYGSKQKKFYSENVLGIIRGKQFPDEYVFLSAHYDHLGYDDDKIYNGADDDGSGTSALLEIGRLFAQAESRDIFPKRSVVFLFVSGEEKGLLGSKYYTDNPILPLEETVVDLNIDMVGRRDTLHDESDEDYIYLIGADKLSSDLHEVSEQVNDMYSNYDLDYTYNNDQHPSRLYYRSDHYNFAKNNIPVIFYFGGMHEDYHMPEDEVDKIDFNILSGVTRLVMATAWHLTNDKDRIEVDKPVRLVR